MPAANLQPITGVDGYIALVKSVSVATIPATPEPFVNTLFMPGGTIQYPPQQIFTTTNRAHKVMDPRVTPTVYVNGVSVSPTQYRIFPGAGLIYFYVPRVESTPVVTADMAYYPTSGGSDVLGILHVNNWQLNLTGNQIQGDEYGTQMMPEYRGKMSGTWQFDRLASSSGIDIFNMMLVQNYFCFALYESISANRMWVVYGDLTGNPISAPGNGMVSGTVNGVLRTTPTFLNEAL